ncbi:MAG TPA: hypothetical protein VGA17_07770 [Nitrospiraceae bacterium]|jgi:hypothetical protein
MVVPSSCAPQTPMPADSCDAGHMIACARSLPSSVCRGVQTEGPLSVTLYPAEFCRISFAIPAFVLLQEIEMPSSGSVSIVHLVIAERSRKEHIRSLQYRVFAEAIAGVDLSTQIPDPGMHIRRMPPDQVGVARQGEQPGPIMWLFN